MNYMNIVMSSSYDIFDLVDQEIKHEDSQENSNKKYEIIKEVNPHLIRDSRSKVL